MGSGRQRLKKKKNSMMFQQSKKKLKVAKVFRIIKMEEYNNGVWNCSQT